jgi:hypothetical protein
MKEQDMHGQNEEKLRLLNQKGVYIFNGNKNEDIE